MELLPHSKKESKLDTKSDRGVINEVADLKVRAGGEGGGWAGLLRGVDGVRMGGVGRVEGELELGCGAATGAVAGLWLGCGWTGLWLWLGCGWAGLWLWLGYGWAVAGVGWGGAGVGQGGAGWGRVAQGVCSLVE